MKFSQGTLTTQIFTSAAMLAAALGGCIVSGALSVISSAHAQQFNAETLPSWIQTVTNADARQDDLGVQLPGSPGNLSHPVVADIDGDLSDGLEVVMASADGRVHALNADGSVRFTVSTPNASCDSPMNRVLSSPAVGELFGDGRKFIVIGYGGLGRARCPGGVIAYSGVDGSVLWNFSLKAFAKKMKFGTTSYSVFSTPALADTDGDGKMEIAFGSYDRNVYLLNANGTVRWYYNAADTVWSSAVFANVNDDPRLELIIATDISRNDRLKPATKDGGMLYAFDTRTRNGKRIGFREKGAYLWSRYMEQVLYAAPVVAELIPENPGSEIAIASGCFFPQSSSSKRGRWLRVVSSKTGAILRTIALQRCTTMSPAVGDIDGDGLNELVAVQPGSTGGNSYLTAFNPRTAQALWSVVPRDRNRNDASHGSFLSPIVADLDGNGSLEVALGHGSLVSVFAGATGEALTCQTGLGCNLPTISAPGAARATPVAADINQDGVLDLVVAGVSRSNSARAAIYGFTLFSNGITSAPGALAPYSAPFPMWRGSASRNPNVQ